MRPFINNWGHYYVGYETEIPQHLVEHQDAVFWEYFLTFTMYNKGFFSVVNAWREKHSSEFSSMMTVFDGHARHTNKCWTLSMEKPDDVAAQDFVNEHDGKAMIILLLCCNPRNRGRVTTKKSLVIYSRNTMSLESMLSRRSKQIIHIPDKGDFVGTDDQERLQEIANEITQG